MNSKEWIAFINSLFVNQDGSRKKAKLALTITAEDREMKLPVIDIAHTDTLQQIFQRVRDTSQFQAENESSTTDTPLQDQSNEHIKVVNVEHIQHGSTEYLAYRMSDNSFVVRKSTGEEVPPKTIIYNTVVKKYREQFNLE